MSTGPFLGAALHVFAAVDHAAAFLVVGLLAGQQPAKRGAVALGAFAFALLLLIRAPLVTSLFGQFAETEAILSAAVLFLCGSLVALGLRLPVWLSAFAAALLGAVHGLALGLGITGKHVALSIAGAAGAAILLAVAGAGLAYVMDGPRGRVVVRVLGSWSAALGLILLGLALRG